MKLPRNAQLWLPGWLAARRRQRAHRFDTSRPVTVHLMFADHFEPFWRQPTDDAAAARVDTWARRWPAIADRHRDDDGQPVQWTFFYPEEEYRPELLDALAKLAHSGFGDVEVHIHHDGEGEADFTGRMARFVTRLARDHGLLHTVDGRPAFGFIHGNWALDNARPDGRWCGLNNEITLLRDLGCYADFTAPAAPDVCQTHLVNAIYWAIDDPAKAKSHDRGPLVIPGANTPADGLLCVQGPLSVRSHSRWRIIPSLEVGELAHYARPTRSRAEHWVADAPRVGNDVFLKLFTHGAPEKNSAPLLDGFVADAISRIRAVAARRGWRLAFATAWQMYQSIEAARAADHVAGTDARSGLSAVAAP